MFSYVTVTTAVYEDSSKSAAACIKQQSSRADLSSNEQASATATRPAVNSTKQQSALLVNAHAL